MGRKVTAVASGKLENWERVSNVELKCGVRRKGRRVVLWPIVVCKGLLSARPSGCRCGCIARS